MPCQSDISSGATGHYFQILPLGLVDLDCFLSGKKVKVTATVECLGSGSFS